MQATSDRTLLQTLSVWQLDPKLAVFFDLRRLGHEM
jgi:hypothetical protein